jgi:hypothetical protein
VDAPIWPGNPSHASDELYVPGLDKDKEERFSLMCHIDWKKEPANTFIKPHASPAEKSCHVALIRSHVSTNSNQPHKATEHSRTATLAV